MQKIERYLEYPQDTRWATDEEITSSFAAVKVDVTDKSQQIDKAGLILKSDGKTVFVDGADHHTMVIGTTGSGKSRLLCMPMIEIMTLAGETFIATDPKGELFYSTSGRARENGYQIVVLNFRDVNRGDMWNPLLIPYEMYQQGEKDHAVSMLNDFIETLTSNENNGIQEPFWTQMAQSLILANCLLLFETGKKEEVNMHSLTRLCLEYGQAKENNKIYKLLKYMNPDSIAAMNYAGVCIDAEKTQSSIMGVVHSVLRVFNTQEGLLRMMADSTFDMRTFGRKKTAVYLIIPDEKSTFHFLASAFTKQCYENLIAEAHKKHGSMSLPVRVNFVLDEFANLPRIPDMASMISAARSRNIRYHLIVQSMNQLVGKYGHDAATISSNCENWVYLNSKEYGCLEEISKRCGNLLDNRNQLRPLITPSRLQRLDKQRGEILIFHCRQYPYITYLPDISRYHFKEYPAMEMTQRKRRNSVVFNLHRLCEELENGKRDLLFYEKNQWDEEPEYHWKVEDNREADYDRNAKYDPEADYGQEDEPNSSQINKAERKDKTSEQLKISGAPGLAESGSAIGKVTSDNRVAASRTADILQSDSEKIKTSMETPGQIYPESQAEQAKKEMKEKLDSLRGNRLALVKNLKEDSSVVRNKRFLEEMLCDDMILDSWYSVFCRIVQTQDLKLKKLWEDEQQCRKSEIAACCAVLIARGSFGEIELSESSWRSYKKWLLGTYIASMKYLADRNLEPRFEPHSRIRRNVTMIGGMAVVIHQLRAHKLEKQLFEYLCQNEECFFYYPVLEQTAEILKQLFTVADEPDSSEKKWAHMENCLNQMKQPFQYQAANSSVIEFLLGPATVQEKETLQAVIKYYEKELTGLQEELKDMESWISEQNAQNKSL